MRQQGLGLCVGTAKGPRQDRDAVAHESRRQQHVKEGGRHQQRGQCRQRNKAVQQVAPRRRSLGGDDVGQPGDRRHKAGADGLHPPHPRHHVVLGQRDDEGLGRAERQKQPEDAQPPLFHTEAQAGEGQQQGYKNGDGKGGHQ